MGKSTPDVPNYGPQIDVANQTAKEQLQMGRDQLAWAKQQDSMNRDILNRTLAVQLPAAEQQAAQAKETYQRYKDVYQPVENQMVTEAQNFDSPERIQQQQGKAEADVQNSFQSQRQNALSRLEGYGVDPSQTRNAALDIGVRTQQAAAEASAASAARQRVEDTGRALRADVVNTGKGLPSQVAANYSGAVSAGQAGVGGANATTGTSSNAMLGSTAFTNAGMNANQQAGNLMNTGFQNQYAATQMGNQNISSTMSGIGSLVGMGASGAFGMADGAQALPVGKTAPGPVNYGPSDGSGIDDQVPAMLSRGEYVIPADVVAHKGKEFFDKLLQKHHTPAALQRQENGRTVMAQGGPVSKPPAVAIVIAPRPATALPVGNATPGTYADGGPEMPPEQMQYLRSLMTRAPAQPQPRVV